MPTKNPAALRVVVIDASAESRSLLVELLSRRGAAAAGFAAWGDDAQAQRVDAIVADCDALSPTAIRALATETGKDAAVVLAGTNRPAIVGMTGVTFVRKPYHYRELLHKIWTSAGARGSSVKAAA